MPGRSQSPSPAGHRAVGQRMLVRLTPRRPSASLPSQPGDSVLQGSPGGDWWVTERECGSSADSQPGAMLPGWAPQFLPPDGTAGHGLQRKQRQKTTGSWGELSSQVVCPQSLPLRAAARGLFARLILLYAQRCSAGS